MDQSSKTIREVNEDDTHIIIKVGWSKCKSAPGYDSMILLQLKKIEFTRWL